VFICLNDQDGVPDKIAHEKFIPELGWNKNDGKRAPG
jgi:hypothetical protein